MPVEVTSGRTGPKHMPKSTNPVGADGISECFQVVRTSLYVSVAPCHVANPTNGIKAQHLDPLIMTYFPMAHGVVLAYCNITVSKEHHALDSHDQPVTIARVGDSTPFAFMWVSVDLLVWHPQTGDILQGHVYMQTASHIGLLVHDTFNAAIRFRSIPQDWEFVPSQADEREGEDSRFKSYGHWVDGSGTKIEGKLTFTVRAIHSTGRMVSIEGSLVSPESEADAQPVSEESHAKHMRFDDVDIETVTVPETVSDMVTDVVPEVAPDLDDGLPTYEKDTNALSSDSDSDSSD